MMPTAGSLARFLVRLGYPDAEVEDTIRDRFPDADAVREVEIARGEQVADDAALQEALDAEARDQEMR